MLHLFKPYVIDSDKIRLGPNEDGGYTISVVSAESAVALVTYGVGHDIRYEECYRDKYDKEIYLYDHTIGRETGWNIGKRLNFINEGLGFNKNCDDFINHYKKLSLFGDVLLKIDIEGAEYDYFEKANIKEIANITTGILLELHWLTEDIYRKRAEKILYKLYEYFTLTHIHGNSWGTTWKYEAYEIPETFELSLVNNKYVKNKKVDNQDYPIKGLDVSNRPGHPDLSLKFLNQL
jgi:hypothetical protein